MVLGVLASVVLGLLASAALTARALRPVGVLGQAVRRLGQGDYAVRARVQDAGSEIGQLANDFNLMAESLQRYRDSSLGELLEAQSAAQATIDSLPDPVVVFDAGGRLGNANRAAEQLLGVRAVGREHHLRRLRRSASGWSAIRDEVLAGAASVQPRGFEEALLVETPDGNRALLPRASAISSDEGRLLGVTVVLQDITRLRRFDELKDDLVATVAHEFRTPLTSLRMAIHLLAEQTVGPLERAAAGSGERRPRGVRAAAEHRRRPAGPGPDPLRPAGAAPPIAVLAPGDWRRRGVGAGAGGPSRECHVSMEIDPGAASITADPDRIELALGNLLINAVRHSRAGGQVTMRARRGRQRGAHRGAGRGTGHRSRVPAPALREVLPRPGLTTRRSGPRALHRPATWWRPTAGGWG